MESSFDTCSPPFRRNGRMCVGPDGIHPKYLRSTRAWSRDTAISKADYYIALQPIRPSARRILYRIEVTLHSVLDLSDPLVLSKLGLGQSSLASIEHSDCRMIGGAVEWLGHDGLLVPSARAEGANLVIFPNRKQPDYRFEVLIPKTCPIPIDPMIGCRLLRCQLRYARRQIRD